MKETNVQYYDDATGEEIDDLFDMVTVKAVKPQSWTSPRRREVKVHFADSTHKLDAGMVDDHEFTAYLNPKREVAMVQVKSGPQVAYHGQDTHWKELAHLIELVNKALEAKEWA